MFRIIELFQSEAPTVEKLRQWLVRTSRASQRERERGSSDVSHEEIAYWFMPLPCAV